MTLLVKVRIAVEEVPCRGFAAVPCFADEPPSRELPVGWEPAATHRPGFRGAEKQLAETVRQDCVLSLHGLGPRADFEGRKLTAWLDRLAEAWALGEVEETLLVLPDVAPCRGAAAAERIIRRLTLGRYAYDRFKSERLPRRGLVVTLVPPPGEREIYAQAAALGSTVAASVAFTRDLANAPANLAGPAWMEERVREFAAERGCRIDVVDAEGLRERGMNGILSVGQGSAQPPRLVRLEWGTRGPLVALVGKGVTFDTGGISIKPALHMEDMKFDKSGACAVLGAFHAVTALDLPVRLRGYLPFAENMPDGSSYRPSDILTCYNGKTVEVINTDAEGRLLLADALALAAEEGAETIVELSTLTGHCVIALGFYGAGLFTPDEELAGELSAAAEASGERLWRLPLWPEFAEEMKGNHADLKNSGARWGGAATAAAFLAQFVGNVGRWAHLDIAGPAQEPSEGTIGSGATGYGVALLVHFLSRLS